MSQINQKLTEEKLPHEQMWRLKQLFDAIKDYPEPKGPFDINISYCGDYGAAAGNCFAGALWLLDHAPVLIEALKNHIIAKDVGIDDPVIMSKKILTAFNAEFGAFQDNRMELVSKALVDMGIALNTNSSDWEKDTNHSFITHAEKASQCFSGTGFELFVLPWAYRIECLDYVSPVVQRINSLRAAIPAKVRGLEISELELNNWAYFLLLVNRWRAATAMASIATEMKRYPRNLDTLGWAYFYEGDSGKSISLLTEALDGHDLKEDVESWAVTAYHKGYVLLHSNMQSEAKDLIDNMLSLAPKSYWTEKARNLLPLIGEHESSETDASTRNKKRGFQYEIALSFAGEDREIALELATALKNRGIKVFYDDFEKATLWGKNLYDYLCDLYQNKAKYCIILISKHYTMKKWTKLERQAAQARALFDDSEYILPVRIDDSSIPGLLPTVSYLDWSTDGLEQIVDSVTNKVHGRE